MDDATRDQLLQQIERIREEAADLRADRLDARARLRHLALAGVDLNRRSATLEAKLVRLGHRLDQRGPNGVNLERPVGLHREQ